MIDFMTNKVGKRLPEDVSREIMENMWTNSLFQLYVIKEKMNW